MPPSSFEVKALPQETPSIYLWQRYHSQGHLSTITLRFLCCPKSVSGAMAIVDEVPGLEIQIYVNGNPLREYVDQHAAVSEATSESYIEVHSNSAFEIHYSFKAPFPVDRPVSMIVTMDGKDIDEPLIRPCELYNQEGHVSSGPISNDGRNWSTKSYRFSPLDISRTSLLLAKQHIDVYTGECSENPIPEDLQKKIRLVGIITCEFYFLNNARRSAKTKFVHRELEKLDTVNEKAIKGESLSHQAMSV